ncbi:MAG TPA: cell envelope integrity protein TolA [Drouetiella sp.]
MGENFENVKIEPKKEVQSSGWLMDNIAHPFVNAAVIEPINAVASVSEAVSGKHLPRVDLLAVPESKDTGSWLAQTFSGGVGAIAPYVVAGKLTGGALESGGRFLESNNLIKTGGMTAKFMASERSATIIGAGLYGAARDPVGNESRFNNAVGSMVGFGVFEYGNSLTKGLSLSRSIPLRALVGAAGGTSQLMTSNFLSEGNIGSTDSLMKAASSGAALNLFLPAVQHGVGRAVDAANVHMGRPIPVDHFAARENWTGNNQLQDVIGRSPLTRVLRGQSGEANINQENNVVHLGPKDGPEKLGHEISHRITAKQAESDFKAAAELLKTDPEAAKQKFIDIRTAQEKAAIEAESRIKAAADMKSAYADTDPSIIQALRANKNMTYGDLFNQEAAQFESSGGKFRPTTDHSGSDYRGKTESGLHLFVFEKPADNPIGGTEKIDAYETNDNKSFQRWTKVGAKVDAEGKTWGTIEVFKEPVETPFGTAKTIETFPDKSIAYHIVKSDIVADNTVLRAYTEGLKTEYGLVTSTVTHPDGRVDYGKMDGSEATKYATPKEEWFGKVDTEDQKLDGSLFYHLTDGATVEWYPNPIKVQMAMPDNSVREVAVSTAWRSNGKASHSMIDKIEGRGEAPPDGEPVAGSAPVKNEYVLSDENTSVEQIYHPDHIEVIERAHQGAEPTSFSPTYIMENYPTPMPSPEGAVNRMVRTFDSTIYDLADGTGTKVQVYDPSHVRPTDYGDANRVVYAKNDFVQYTLTNGNKVLTNTERTIGTDYGDAKAIETAPNGSEYYHRPNGSVVEVYPEEVTSNLGAFKAFERTSNGLILYRPAGAADFYAVELNFANKTSTYSDASGNLIADGFKPLDNFKLLRKFNPAQYPDGQTIPNVGKVRSIETDPDGYNVYQLVDNSYVTDKPATP